MTTLAHQQAGGANHGSELRVAPLGHRHHSHTTAIVMTAGANPELQTQCHSTGTLPLSV